MLCLHNCILLFQVFHKYLQRALLKATTSAKKYSLICTLLWLHALHKNTLWIYTRQYMHACIIQLYVNLLHFTIVAETRMHANAHTHTQTHPHRYTQTQTQTHTDTHTDTQTHTHIHTKVYWYIYMCVLGRKLVVVITI